MAKPLRATAEVFSRDDRVSKIEFLPNPNVLADYALNLNTEVLRTAVEDMWENAIGVLRLEGLRKAYRGPGEGTPATGKIVVLHPGLIADGEWFELDDGTTRVRFEFDKDSSVGGGNVAIDISTAETVDDVRIATEDAINGSAVTIFAQPTRRQSPAAGSAGIGGEIDLSNTTLDSSISGSAAESTPATSQASPGAQIVDNVRDERFQHVGMRSSSPIYALGRITVPAPAELVDGETLTIPGNSGPDAVLEFDDNGDVESGNISVDLTGITTDQQLRARVVTAANSASGDTDVTAVADDLPARGYITALDPSKHVDGETVTLHDGSTQKIFEVDKDGGGVTAGNVAVDISAAADMQDVRAAWITAINAQTFGIKAFSRGFGARVQLTNTVGNASAGNRTISDTVAHVDFKVGHMAGGAASIRMEATVSGLVMNREITDTVESDLFVVEGMAGGIEDGWDVTPGHCAFKAFDVVLDKITRCSTVVGTQNFMSVRLRERLIDVDSDPDIVEVSGPGVLVPKPGPNQYRWVPQVVVEAADAPAPVLAGKEVRIVDGLLAEFDAVDGNTIVDEVEIRGTKFGRFLEPQDVTLKVNRVGDTMTGNLLPDGDGTRNLGSIGSTQRWNVDAYGLTARTADVSQDLTAQRTTYAQTTGSRTGSLLDPGGGTQVLVASGGTIEHISTVARTVGSEITLIFSSGSSILAHAVGSPPANSARIFLANNDDYTFASGDALTLVLHQLGATLYWLEKSRAVGTDILPESDATSSLGTASRRWNVQAGSVAANDIDVSSLVVDDEVACDLISDGNRTLGSSLYPWHAYLGTVQAIDNVNCDIVPNANDARALGSTSKRWDAHLQDVKVYSGATFAARKLGPPVVAASYASTTLTLGASNINTVGTGTIDYITTTGWDAGSEVTLLFTAAVTVTQGIVGGPPSNTAKLKLAGSGNYSADADDVLTLVYDGSFWVEKCRSVNG